MSDTPPPIGSAADGTGLRSLPSGVLVTGADGQIGRAAAEALLAAGCDVAGLALDWTGEVPDGLRQFTGDACDEDLVGAALAGIDAVVHLAARPHPTAGTPYEVFRTNTSATFNVLDQAAQQGIRRAVIASSINAFGVPLNHHDILPAYLPIDEDIPIALDDWYSLSKFVDERTAEMMHSRWGIDVLALRIPYVRSIAALREYAATIESSPEFARLGREGWAYLALEDVVELILTGLRAPLSGAHVVLAAAVDILSYRPTEELIEQYLPGVPRHRPFPGHSGLIDIDRVAALLGWAPAHSIRDTDENDGDTSGDGDDGDRAVSARAMAEQT